MRHVTLPHTTRDRIRHVPADTWDCVTCLDTWLHWLQPYNWLDTSWPVSRVIINIIIIILVIIVIIIIVKLFRALLNGGKIVFCCFCKTTSQDLKSKLRKTDIFLKTLGESVKIEEQR